MYLARFSPLASSFNDFLVDWPGQPHDTCADQVEPGKPVDGEPEDTERFPQIGDGYE